MKMKRRKWRWVNTDGYYGIHNMILYVCRKEFEAVFGFLPPAGKSLKLKMSAKVVK